MLTIYGCSLMSTGLQNHNALNYRMQIIADDAGSGSSGRSPVTIGNAQFPSLFLNTTVVRGSSTSIVSTSSCF